MVRFIFAIRSWSQCANTVCISLLPTLMLLILMCQGWQINVRTMLPDQITSNLILLYSTFTSKRWRTIFFLVLTLKLNSWIWTFLTPWDETRLKLKNIIHLETRRDQNETKKWPFFYGVFLVRKLGNIASADVACLLLPWF